MRHARDGAPVRWADLALSHGYFDQSHLVRDVRRFTGLTPTGALVSLSALGAIQVNSFQDGARG
jgi:hypothetical protein